MTSTVASPRPSGDSTPPASLWARAWPHIRRWAPALLGVVVLGLLLSHAHKVDWAGAWAALKKYEVKTLVTVFAITTASHALYGCFDLIGRRHTRHTLSAMQTWAIAVTSYAFNLNLGALVGGMAMRARLYARAGLEAATVAQIVGLSLATNWLGYALLGGGLFAAGVIVPPPQAHMAGTTLRVLGAVMVLAAIGYVVACAFWHGTEWKIRGKRIHLPSPRIAVLQLVMSSANWALMGTAMWMLLGGKVEWGMALGTLMAASIVGVMVPIPAGLGVLEAVYLALLSGVVPQGELMGAVLAYRALYYLVPLAGGLAMYVALERKFK